LTDLGIPTAKGAAQWQPTAVDKILRREANKGTFLYQKAQRAVPGRSSTPRDPYRQNRKSGRKVRPRDEWIPIRVPAIVDEATWEAAQRQLEENSRYSQRNNKRHTYLLKGLMRCPRCGGMYTGHAQHGLRRYRCINSDAAVSSTGMKCAPGSVSADKVEVLVWDAVREALQQPEVLAQEYERRLAEAMLPASIEMDKKQMSLALRRVKAQEDRVTEAYINEAMGLDRYKAEMGKLQVRREQLERAAGDIERRKQREQDNKRALENLRGFCDRVAKGLACFTFEDKQKLLRLVIERITITDGKVKIETIIPTGEDPVQLRTRHPELVEG
jgi:site-specific DNA recombinase